jgi:hypothetical protein
MQKKVSGRFFVKKLRKKLLLVRATGGEPRGAKLTKVFCGAFLQKSDPLLKV